jgi:hypothetical protein
MAIWTCLAHSRPCSRCRAKSGLLCWHVGRALKKTWSAEIEGGPLPHPQPRCQGTVLDCCARRPILGCRALPVIRAHHRMPPRHAARLSTTVLPHLALDDGRAIALQTRYDARGTNFRVVASQAQVSTGTAPTIPADQWSPSLAPPQQRARYRSSPD